MRVLTIAIMLGLAACEQAKPPADAVDKAEKSSADPVAAIVPASDLLIKRSTPELDFAWRAPAELADAPGLFKSLRAEALKTADEIAANAKADMASRPAGAPAAQYFYAEEWRVAADTPTLLNLSSEFSTYTGGAHPDHGFASKYWDKTAAREITFADLFTDWKAAEAALSPAYCKALDVARVEKRGQIEEGSFDDCPRLAEQPVALIDYPAAGVSGFRVLLGPYVAGPYAEGDYEIDVELTVAVRRLLKPVYFPD